MFGLENQHLPQSVAQMLSQKKSFPCLFVLTQSSCSGYFGHRSATRHLLYHATHTHTHTQVEKVFLKKAVTHQNTQTLAASLKKQLCFSADALSDRGIGLQGK